MFCRRHNRWGLWFRCLGGKTALPRACRSRVRIHDDLPVIPQIDGVNVGKLGSPLLDMRHIDPETLEEVRRTQVNQHGTLGVVHDHFDVVRVGEIDFTQLL